MSKSKKVTRPLDQVHDGDGTGQASSKPDPKEDVMNQMSSQSVAPAPATNTSSIGPSPEIANRPWNPWGLEEVTADVAKKRLAVLAQYPYWKARIEERSGRPFLVVDEIDGNCLGGELIAETDVEAIRVMVEA